MNDATKHLLQHCENSTLSKTILEQLLRDGADINTTHGDTCPLWICLVNKNWNIAWMLIQYGASTNTNIFGQSIFLKAIQIAPPFLIDIITRCPGNDAHAKDDLGFGCIHYACERNDPTILQLIMNHCRVSILETSNAGDTAIDIISPATDPILAQRVSIYTLMATTTQLGTHAIQL